MVAHFVLALVLIASPAAAAQNDAAHQAAQRLDRFAARQDLSSENRFLHEQAAALLERWRQAPAQSFLAGRMELAVHNLLDASDHILQARNRRQGDDRSEETRRLMSRDLERTYFRIQEGEYFSKQAQEAPGDQYVVAARHLYQIARTAYDEQDYGRVKLLSQAVRDVLDALEMLAQAGRGVPDPPRIPD